MGRPRDAASGPRAAGHSRGAERYMASGAIFAELDDDIEHVMMAKALE